MNQRHFAFRFYDVVRGKFLDASWVEAFTLSQLLEGNVYVPSQAINLNDVHGATIYEGDYVRATAEPEYEEESGLYEVFFNAKEMQFQLRPEDHNCGLAPTWLGWSSLEVVGNIYQHDRKTLEAAELA